MTEKILFDDFVESCEKTEALGAELARRILAGGQRRVFLALYGELGAGKTAFTRGLASVLTPGAQVHSPTYTIVNEYRGALPIYHFDLYRIADEDDLYSVGYWDYPERDGVIVTEWSENAPYILPDHYYRVTIRYEKEGRHITICAIGEMP